MPTPIYPGVGYVLLQENELIMGDTEMFAPWDGEWGPAPFALNPETGHMGSYYNPHRRPRTHAEVVAAMPGMALPALPEGWAYVMPDEILPPGARFFSAEDDLGDFMTVSAPTGAVGLPNVLGGPTPWHYAAPLGAGATNAAHSPPATQTAAVVTSSRPPATQTAAVVTSSRPPRGVRRASVVPLNLP